jgi:DNA-binding NarL/FixJ family response regulator
VATRGFDRRRASVSAVGHNGVVRVNTKRILLVASHNAFREALARRLSQETDLEVAWQAGSIAATRDMHLEGINVAVIDPLLPDGNGIVLIREMSVAYPDVLALVFSHRPDSALYHQARRAGAVDVLSTAIPVENCIAAIRNTAAYG